VIARWLPVSRAGLYCRRIRSQKLGARKDASTDCRHSWRPGGSRASPLLHLLRQNPANIVFPFALRASARENYSA